MKKFLILAAFLGWGVVSQAMPSVGDYISYKMTLTNIASSQSAIVNTTMKIDSYDAASKSYSTTTTAVMGEQTQTSSQLYKETELPTDAQVADVLTKCAGYGGVKEVLSINGKQLDTCKISNASGSLWYGAVPTALAGADIITKQGDQQLSIKMEVTDYGFGK